MLNVKYDYSSVHVDVPNPLAKEIIDWGKLQVSDDDIFVTHNDPTFGREDEIHVTILYGLHSNSSKEAQELLAQTGPITVKLGKVDIFTDPFKFDVVMIEVISEDLRQLNNLLQTNVKFTNKYGAYKPHITIAYVKKGKGKKHKGLTCWQGVEFNCDYAVFSSKDGFKQKILLQDWVPERTDTSPVILPETSHADVPITLCSIAETES